MPVFKYYSKFVFLFLFIASSFYCSKEKYELQSFKPQSDISLEALLNLIPILSSSFHKLDGFTVNELMFNFLENDPETSVFLLFELSKLMRDNPQLPLIVDGLSGPLHDFATFYQQDTRTEEFKTGFNSIGKLLSTNPTLMKQLLLVLSKLIHSFGDQNVLFPSAINTFPDIHLWNACKSNGSTFNSQKPPYMEQTRSIVFNIYDLTRFPYCFFDNKTFTDDLVVQLRDTIDTIVNLGDMESRISSLVYTLENDIESIKDLETLLADLLVKDPDLVAISNYLIADLYPILRKESTLFEDLKNILDREAPHLSVKSPNPYPSAHGRDEYLLESVMTKLYPDLDKFYTLDTITDFTDNAKFTKVKATALYSFTKDFVENAVKNIFIDNEEADADDMGSKAYARNTFEGIIWDGANHIPPLINSGTINKGSIYSLLENTTENTTQTSLFRQSVKQVVPSTEIDIPTNLVGESPLGAVVDDLYYNFLKNYYHPTQHAWASTPKDGFDLFRNYNRNVIHDLTNLQYSLYNGMYLNANANSTFKGSDISNIPYLNYLMFLLSMLGGYLPGHASLGSLNLGEALVLNNGPISSGSRAVSVLNIGSINVDLTLELVANSGSATNIIPNSVRRNLVPFIPGFDSYVFELITPGNYYKRDTDPNTGLYRAFKEEGVYGNFAAHQGDIHTENLADTSYAQLTMFGQMGYGPYTVNGKAPNGSRLKYENSYYTDYYDVEFCEGENINFFGGGALTQDRQCVDDSVEDDSVEDDRVEKVAMGYNIRNYGDNRNAFGKTGRIKVYESIYRPMKSSDPCWIDAEPQTTTDSNGNTIQYVRYGYLRPTNNTDYNDNTHCSSWSKIQVDFSSTHRAASENVAWVLNYKKYFLIVGFSAYTTASLVSEINQGITLGLFFIAEANGLLGMLNLKSTEGNLNTHNSKWAKNLTMTSKYSTNRTKGTFQGMPAVTTQYNVSSFTAGDTRVAFDYIFQIIGNDLIAGLLVDPERLILDSLGSGLLVRPEWNQNLEHLAHLVNTRYTDNQLLDNIENKAQKNVSKFTKFFNEFYPNSSIIKKYSHAGCKESSGERAGERVPNCLTGIELPLLPKVKGVSYPSRYDNDGNITAWSTWDAQNDLKFAGLLNVLTQIFNTFYDSADVYYDHDNTPTTPGIKMPASLSKDNVTIAHYSDTGFKAKGLANISSLLAILNELSFTDHTGANYKASYNPDALISKIIETSPGSRDGLLIELMKSKYFHLGNYPFVVDDIKKIISTTSTDVFDLFEITKDRAQNGSFHQLRYFLTDNIVGDPLLEIKDENNDLVNVTVTSNYLGLEAEDKITRGTAEPLTVLGDFLQFGRQALNDDDLLTSLKKGVTLVNNYTSKHDDLNFSIPINEANFDQLKDLLNLQGEGVEGYVLDSFIKLLVELEIADIDKLANFDFDHFKNLDFDNILETSDNLSQAAFGNSLYEILLLNPFFLGEPTCIGGASNGFYDFNKNGRHDPGLLRIMKRNTTGRNFQVNANINGNCTISIAIPSITDFASYAPSGQNISNTLKLSLDRVTKKDVVSVLNKFYDASNYNTDKLVNDIKNKMINSIYDKEFLEPSSDVNNNSIIDSGEFLDIDENNTYDPDTKVKLKQFIEFFVNKIKENLYEKEEKSRNMVLSQTILALLRTGLEVANPYTASCTGSEGIGDTNCLYIMSDFVAAQKKMNQYFNIEPNELLALKNMLGYLLYSEQKNLYTYPLSRVAPNLAIVLGSFEGKYDELLYLLRQGLNDNQFLSYVLNNVSMPKEYDAHDLLQEIISLLNSKLMRNYDSPSTFWWLLGDLAEDLGEAAYITHNMSWDEKRNIKLYDGVASIFNR